MLNDTIIVGMADLNVTKDSGKLTTLGLGSCLGIVLYDNVTKVGGMAHVMLPDSTQIRNNANNAKFVDTGTITLIEKMRAAGARTTNLKAKIAGGAQMFAVTGNNENMKIGDRNIEACLKLLGNLNIPIIGRDVGLNYGRTITLHTDDGRLEIKTIGHGIKSI